MVETVVALGLMFTVLVGLLGTMVSSVKAVVTARQRGVALAMANQVLETARSTKYAEVGHDLSSAGTAALAADGRLVLDGSVWRYSATSEALSVSSRPQAPFAPHQWTRVTEGTTYTTSLYVTDVAPGAGTDPHKRVRVVVSWRRPQYDTSKIVPEIRLESLLYESADPADPLLTGLSEADGGWIRVTGTMGGSDLSQMVYWFPVGHGELDSRFIRRSNGFSNTARSKLELNTPAAPGDLDGCQTDASNTTSECPGVKAETVADNDAGTNPSPADHDVVDLIDLGGTTEDGGSFQTTTGQSQATSKSTALSCFACFATPIGDDDRLPYHESDAQGPASMNMGFEASGTTGAVARASSPARSTATVDRDDAGSDRRIAARSTTTHPAMDILPFDDPVFNLLGGGLGILPPFTSVVRASSPARSTATVDRDDAGTDRRIASRSTTTHPAMDILPFDDPVFNLLGGGLGILPPFTSVVHIDAATVAATANAGPGAAPPGISGAAFNVRMLQTGTNALGLPTSSYVDVPITPGTASTNSTNVDLRVGGNRIAITTTVESRPAAVRSTSAGGAVTHAEAGLTNWLTVSVRFTVTTLVGAPIADLNIDVDYGRLFTSTDYDAP